MSNVDDAKGKVKEAAGDLSGNDNLKAEGKLDQVGGKAKDAVDATKDKLGSVLHKD
ncbi:CsbD family protein [Acidiferrimicrobium sp. IK]|uniref:CsbD family protein n=1 Tax=Acidiferrimicrobium sp. IK TaxID=2871700 RepID=UPI0021CAEF8F|nr:CsbD family protein [Acidiferrimicrobium sp. IK]MCU4187120.1 CsbD family protein [Acidiferrimicrobium sp. IK]